jgi:hypothetical protein
MQGGSPGLNFTLGSSIGLERWKVKTIIPWGLPDQKMSHSLTPSLGWELMLVTIYSLEVPENFQANFPESLLLCPTL